MKVKIFVFYIIGFFIFCGVGFYKNYVVGFLVGLVLYVLLLVLIGVFFGFTSVDPIEKSIYERRKKE